ncbi:host specificity protein J [Pseudomonas syringae group genomosp. 3]|uniref:Host specificity protein J n=1 Tax=Pseudomonas syringae pv. persicae TaxID=237306 RepID=A0AB38E9U3_9PSED|nr:host specificity protein J [Pseudomonas syringae group genomosp. 3]SOQ06530.1 Host specificity protein J [Pseudomonas syringae pv. persicae]SOQ06845.1 Host specificity protein J [Pseudomonas syringae pv. persicae]
MSDSIQSSDYVPGVSGWKIDGNGRLELNDGNRRVIAKMLMVTTAGPGMTNDQAQASITESLREEVSARSHADKSVATQIGALQCNVGRDVPFTVEGDQVILSRASIDAAKISPLWVVRTTTNAAGQTVMAGIGAGLGCMCEGGHTRPPGDKEERAEVKVDFTGDVSKRLDKLLAAISETELGKSLTAKINQIPYRSETQLPDRVKTLEACVVQLNSELGRLVVAISSLVSGNTKQ